ncbi:carbonic anhydrase [Chitiniphilus shinanonensis]|uniref:carbonic anhydrase n=1 Tax=Chitiniphilus shinanonensis TaxID=553088 RepID=A0ABQ6BS38_9NEIS|nr:carbonic anhydrase [Chitiniphilus shinanonensis]GLS04141.1 carbonic anhydrase [Chitiniphilus shinanonensis]
MKKLFEGAHRFRTQTHPYRRQLFRTLAKGQRPEVLFITCSDSRIDPNLLTHTEPGDLFVLRNAGNIVPPHGSGGGGEQATIDYAVEVLGVEHIVVCGHTDCGAMKALFDPASLEGLPTVGRWLSYAEATRSVVRCTCQQLPAGEQLDEAIRQNVRVQLNHLRTIPSVNARLAQRRLQLHGWVYDIAQGDVLVLDEASGLFSSLASLELATA